MDIEENALDFSGPARLYHGGNSSLRTCSYRGMPLLYKRYHADHLAGLNLAALRGMVEWRERLPADRRARLDEIAAWPRHMAIGPSGLSGVLMAEAAAPFLYRRDGRSGARTFSELITFRSAGSVHAGASLAAKKRAVAQAVQSLLWLHELGVTMVDVQPDNLLSTHDGHRVFFVDCDVAWGPWGRPTRPEAPEYMHSAIPDYADPGHDTDLARMAWVILWLLTDDHVGRPVQAGLVDERVEAFLRRRLTERRADGGSKAAWLDLARDWAAVRDEPIRTQVRVGTLGDQQRWRWIPEEFLVHSLRYRLPDPIEDWPGTGHDRYPEPRGRAVPTPVLVLGLAIVIGLIFFAALEAYRGGIL
jgi:hypothetical protein